MKKSTLMPLAPFGKRPVGGGLSTATTLLLLVSLVTHLWLSFKGPSLGPTPLVGCPIPTLPSLPTPSMTLSNRKSFYSALSRSFKSAQPKLILLASSPRPIRRDADTEYPAYRQSGNVMYLLGNFQISPALIVLRINGVNDTMLPRIDLYLPELTQRESIFSGPYPDFETLKKKFQIDGVYLMKDLVNTFVKDSVLIGSSKEDILETIASNSIAKAALEPLLTLQPDATLLNAFAQARFVKSAEEIQVLRSASRIARWAHHTVEKSIYNDATVNEAQIFSLFQHVSMLCGGRLQAYNPIVGSGPHGATLHFRTGENITQAYAPISNADKSQFILVDAAPELEGYASDLTRTYTRYPQHATQEMRLLHKAVQNIQSGAILVFKEGSSWAQVDRRALELLTEALMDLQLLHGPYEKLVQDRVAYAFMPHGLGHPVGLDVHDPIPTEYKMAPIDSSASNSDLNLLSRLSIKSIDFPIVRGSVMTIEPGIYFIPHWLDSLRGNKTDSLGQWINWTQVDEFGYGIGGVRIEDTIAIDPLTGDSVILTDF